MNDKQATKNLPITDKAATNIMVTIDHDTSLFCLGVKKSSKIVLMLMSLYFLLKKEKLFRLNLRKILCCGA